MAWRAVQNTLKQDIAAGKAPVITKDVSSLVTYIPKPDRLSLEGVYLMPTGTTSDYSAPGSFIITGFANLPAEPPIVDVVDESIEGNILKMDATKMKHPLFKRVSPTTIEIYVVEVKREGSGKQEVRQRRLFAKDHPFCVSIGDVFRIGVSTKMGGLPSLIGTPVMIGNFYLTASTRIEKKEKKTLTSIYPSADSVITTVRPADETVGRALIREELFPVLMPYEQQHLPRIADAGMAGRLDAQLLTPIGPPVDHTYTRAPAALLSLNSSLGDGDEGGRFVLPDAAFCHSEKTARGGTTLALSQRKVAFAIKPAQKDGPVDVPMLESGISGRITDYARWDEPPCVTGVNNLKDFESAHVLSGLPHPRIAAALMMPDKSLGRPPVPAYALFEADFLAGTHDPNNSASGAGGLKETGVNQLLTGRNIVVIPRTVEYTARYGIRVSREFVAKRFAMAYEQKDLAMPAENGGFTYADWCYNVFTFGKSAIPNPERVLQAPSFTMPGDLGFVILDGLSERLDQILADPTLPWDFYAVCVAKELPDPLVLPLEDDPDMVAKVGEEAAPRRCAIKTEEAGRAYVLSVLDHFRAKRGPLAKKHPTLSEDALRDPAIHMQDPVEFPSRPAPRKGRLPLFLYVAILKGYKPLDPGAIVQPSIKNALTVVVPPVKEEEGAAAGGVKRARDEPAGPTDAPASKAARPDEVKDEPTAPMASPKEEEEEENAVDFND